MFLKSRSLVKDIFLGEDEDTKEIMHFFDEFARPVKKLSISLVTAKETNLLGG